MITIVVPVTGNVPQASVHDIRRIDLNVTRYLMAAAHIGNKRLKDCPAPGMPENRARCIVLKMKQIQLPTQLAMVAFLRFSRFLKPAIKLFFACPCRAINPLQLYIAGFPLPVRTR
ncbi:hypothetical protein UUU_36490 (plasmid) [Klebsiella pneumoniae subsp. pneumoniae DSM 30104 = JCM 1662 = NBRC 14940]|nr:hypothetical protein UUU_36490 [Klebsiella pneumoniae subsp. pneumoniae DSM 30104 = JCM 1662 = NBRC 14940]